jgi:hypothetical protein
VCGELKIKSLVTVVAPPQRRAKSGTSSPEKKRLVPVFQDLLFVVGLGPLEQVFGVSRELISQVK